jgi:hypothetical protein
MLHFAPYHYYYFDRNLFITKLFQHVNILETYQHVLFS